MGENIYPNLNEYKQDLEKQKLINFKNDLDYLKQQIVHYNKLYKKWKEIDSVLRYFSIVITGVSSIGSVTILSIGTGGVLSPLILPLSLGFGSLTVFTNFLDGILSKTVSSKRKKKYLEILKVFEQAKNELFLFHQKALIDNKLEDTEIKISHEVVERCKNYILKEKNNNTEIEDLKKQMTALTESLKSPNFNLNYTRNLD